jgi:hypothetical protein
MGIGVLILSEMDQEGAGDSSERTNESNNSSEVKENTIKENVGRRVFVAGENARRR